MTRWRRRSRCPSHSSLQPTASSLAARSPSALSVTHFISKRLILLSLPSERRSNKAGFRREICESDTWFQAARSNLPLEITTTEVKQLQVIFPAVCQGRYYLGAIKSVLCCFSYFFYFWLIWQLLRLPQAWGQRRSKPNSQQGAVLLRNRDRLLSLNIVTNKYPRLLPKMHFVPSQTTHNTSSVHKWSLALVQSAPVLALNPQPCLSILRNKNRSLPTLFFLAH